MPAYTDTCTKGKQFPLTIGLLVDRLQGEVLKVSTECYLQVILEKADQGYWPWGQ